MNHEGVTPLTVKLDAAVSLDEPPATELAMLRLELAGQKDLTLRMAADFENFKRRSRQENEGRAVAQKEEFIEELLPVVDSLERALASGASGDSPQFHQGVELTLRQLRQLLQKHGIEPQECIGRKFDPHQHDAVALRYEISQPDHSVLEVFQCGYRRGEKVFRPAKVVVNDLTQASHVR